MRKVHHHTVTVDSLPDCAFSQTIRHVASGPVKARYDARLTKLGNGVWACVCQSCFDFFQCELGLGKGQELILANNQEKGEA